MNAVFKLLLWFAMWAPLVSLLEYGAHRWIMHQANRLLDPNLEQLKSHSAHHRGANDDDLLDVPLKYCLMLTSPAFMVLFLCGLSTGFAVVLIPAVALLAWCFLYPRLWARIHRAIHGLEANWFQRLGPVYRFYRHHHLTHHAMAKANYGTIFPCTDILFSTTRDRRRPG